MKDKIEYTLDQDLFEAFKKTLIGTRFDKNGIIDIDSIFEQYMKDEITLNEKMNKISISTRQTSK